MKHLWRYYLSIFVILAISAGFLYYLESEQATEKKSSNNTTEATVPVETIPKETSESETSFSFVIAGDMMLDRNIDYNFRGQKIYDLFSNFGQEVFQGADLSMVNLEGPISARPIPADNSESLVFNFPPTTPDLLNWLHINAVGLANNHTLNAGASGLSYTRKVLTEKGISNFGNPNNIDAASVGRFDNGKIKVSVIAAQLIDNKTSLVPLITTEKANGYKVIVFPHWGTEYEAKNSIIQQNMAHAWIDAGADLVLGSHPHVMQNAERYKDKFIFYSLGNFVFDQNFSIPTQRGLILAGIFSGNAIEIKLIPIKSVKFKPELMIEDEKTVIVNKIRAELDLSACLDHECDRISIE